MFARSGDIYFLLGDDMALDTRASREGSIAGERTREAGTRSLTSLYESLTVKCTHFSAEVFVAERSTFRPWLVALTIGFALLLTTAVGCSQKKDDKLTIDYPPKDSAFNKPDLLICGSASSGATIVLSSPPERITADSDGHWEYRTTLEEPAPGSFLTLEDFEFSLDGSPDTKVSTLLSYAPGHPDSPLSTCPNAAQLTIDYPTNNAAVNSGDLLICGSAAPGKTVGRDLRLQVDPKMTVDASGHWEYRTTVDAGDHDFEFYLDDSQDIRATVKIIYSPGVSVTPLTTCLGVASTGGATTPTTSTQATLPPTPAPNLIASAQDLLTITDLPAGWTPEDPDPGSAIADPSTYTACGPTAATPLDVGFGSDTFGQFAGQILIGYSSIDEAKAGFAASEDRVKSCTENDQYGTTTSIGVQTQPFASYGDESAAYRVDLRGGSGTSLGYVAIIRKSNLVTTLFYLDLHGGDGLALLNTLAQTSVGRLGE